MLKKDNVAIPESKMKKAAKRNMDKPRVQSSPRQSPGLECNQLLT